MLKVQASLKLKFVYIDLFDISYSLKYYLDNKIKNIVDNM